MLFISAHSAIKCRHRFTLYGQAIRHLLYFSRDVRPNISLHLRRRHLLGTRALLTHVPIYFGAILIRFDIYEVDYYAAYFRRISLYRPKFISARAALHLASLDNEVKTLNFC